jgi:protein-S-isoprenylcysteine O-methyltransferase Ste14
VTGDEAGKILMVLQGAGEADTWECTRLRVDGLFRFSRNPMYLGVYSTLLASVLYV